MSDATRISVWLDLVWNTPGFQFRLAHFVKTKRDREIISHLRGFTSQHPDATLDQWASSIASEPKYRNRGMTPESATATLVEEILPKLGFLYEGMTEKLRVGTESCTNQFDLLMDAARGVAEVTPRPDESSHSAQHLFEMGLANLQQQIARVEQEEKEFSDAHAEYVRSKGKFERELKDARVLRDACEQEISLLARLVRKSLSSDADQAIKTLGELKQKQLERQELLDRVKQLASKQAEMRNSERRREEREITRKHLAANVDILKHAADLLGVVLPSKPTSSHSGSGSQKPKPRPRRSHSPKGDGQPSLLNSSFTLPQSMRERINKFDDGTWYGSKFGHAGVVRAASGDPSFKSNADFLEALLNDTFDEKVSQIQLQPNHAWVLRAASAVRNRIRAFVLTGFYEGETMRRLEEHVSSLEALVKSERSSNHRAS